MSDHSVAHGIAMFCNRSDAVRKTGNRRTVESFYKNETEQNVNIILSPTVAIGLWVI